MTRDISIGLILSGYAGGDRKVAIKGAPDADAIAALEDAVSEALGHRLHRDSSEPDKSMFLFEEIDHDDAVPLGWDIFPIPAVLTFADLRLLAGPHDSTTRVRLRGSGGDGMFGLTLWELADLLDFGRDALEVYGAMELAHRAGRMLRRRTRRNMRRLANAWFHDGGPVPSTLRDAVEQRDAWSDDALATFLELDRAEGRQLMEACGYVWSTDRGRYYGPRDSDAVN
ncbi:hypothetical protein C3481_06440 [Microbacterium sp. Ru50]|uniref:hypothetical protein n=1 Tax=Microbacterium sp. Ru50 TaxID=2080744 RepID=UPI000CDE00DC|nr:hypothetical protein [Microbacterium sp. Ru50]POX67820.1 hypothetical protein C3481_06440 [Microbacterium sp. Ru50]